MLISVDINKKGAIEMRSRITKMMAVAVAIGLGAAFGSYPASASESNPETTDPTTTTFSAIGYVPGDVGDNVDFAELAAIGV